MSVIECNGLIKIYHHTKALNSLTLNIEKNKITGLIGRNGAGKTTLLKIIAGHLKATSGEIKVFSENPFNSLKVSANHIFIHDQMSLPTALCLEEMLMESDRFYDNWDRDLAKRLFDYFSFHPLQRFDDLSKGMKSTFKMILGLAARCPLTIFDEPTSGMDAAVRKDFYRALLKDYIANPRSFIISSHHLEEMEDLLEDILLMKDGSILLHMPTADLREWAIGLQGKITVVNEWAKNREVIHSRDIGLESRYLVVKNDFSKSEMEAALAAGVNFHPVTTSDLCVYLTGKTKGGIDDVFSESQFTSGS